MEKSEARPATPEDQKWVAKLFDANKDILGKVSGGTAFWRWQTRGGPQEKWFVIPELAFAHWYIRKDGTKVLYEIAVSKDAKRMGLGKKLLDLIGLPCELKTDAEHPESNAFYQALGFKKMGYQNASSGKRKAIYQKW